MPKEKTRPSALSIKDGIASTTTQEDWWLKDSGHGFISPFLLAPDPNQPRRYMDPEELRSLTDSIGETGVVESIVVTPLSETPWVTISNKDQDAFFVVVSGHRRLQAALDTGKSTVPVRVRIYKNAEEHETDMILLNGPRADLTPLEDGYAVIRLLRQEGVTIEKVGRVRGKSVLWIQGRIALTRLAPDIQELLSPRLKAKQRLQIQIGTMLGELPVPSEKILSELLFWSQDDSINPRELSADERRFCFQRLALAEIRTQCMSAMKAKDRIHELAKMTNPSSGMGSRSTRDEPRKRRDIVLNLLNTIKRSPVLSWSDKVLRKAFKPATLAQLEAFVSEAEARRDDLETLIETLATILDEKQKHVQDKASISNVTEPSENEVLSAKNPTTAKSKTTVPSPTPTPSIPKKPKPCQTAKTVNPNSISFPMEAEFWSYGPPGKLLLGSVRSPFHFVELWERGHFGWQMRKRSRPTNFPDIAEVQKIIGS